MRIFNILTLGIMFLGSGCKNDQAEPTTEKFEDGLEITFVTAPNKKDIEEVRFVKGPTSLDFGRQSEGLLFRQIVSPNREWILLPQTLWGDFLFCKRTDVMKCLEDPKRFTRLTEGSDHPVYFRFIRWEAPATIVMSFTFNDEEEEWGINLETRSTKKLDGNRVIFEPKFE